jgi:nitroreductase
MAEIIQELVDRRARRAYAERPIERSVLERILEAGTLAPSCSNKQPWRFLVCNEDPALGKVREGLNGGNYWARRAPVMVVVTTRDELDCRLDDDRNYAQFDTGMAVMGLLLQATREGLYAHPMAGWSPEKVRQAFSIEGETRVIALIALGYPGETSHLNDKHLESESSQRERKPLDEVVQWNTWNSLG